MHTLSDFYQTIHATINPRRWIVAASLETRKLQRDDVSLLEKTLLTLEKHCDNQNNVTLMLDDTQSITLNLDYEIKELRKDLLFLFEGEMALLGEMRRQQANFNTQVDTIVNALQSVNINTLVTDRDGTINHYCGRYLSSVQSIYNAMFLTRFAQTIHRACIITSASLTNPGLSTVNILRQEDAILSGSKGREAFLPNGNKINYEADPKHIAKLVELNHHITDLMAQPDHIKFTYIGSGLQIKFGQTAIARQDINNSIDEQESLALLDRITSMVNNADPNQEYFRIEDTGRDIEIHLTVDDGPNKKDFDKGDGLKFLNENSDLDLSAGPALICGDTMADTPMITEAQKHTDTHVVFVTTDQALKDHVHSLAPNTLFVDSPDILITALNKLSSKKH